MLSRTSCFLFSNLKQKLPKHNIFLDPSNYRLAHPVYKLDDVNDVKADHFEP